MFTSRFRFQSPMRTRRALAAVAAGVLVGLVALPSIALAHAELDTMTPADKSTGPSPTEIVGTFVQDLVAANSSFTVVDSAGAVVAKGGVVASDNPRKMTLALTTPLDPGAYTIRWATKSAEDGESAKGTTTFTVVAAPSPTPEPSQEASAVAPSASAAAPSGASSVAPSAAPSAPPTAPATSTSDAIIPVVIALVVLAGLGLWLLRGRSRAGR